MCLKVNLSLYESTGRKDFCYHRTFLTNTSAIGSTTYTRMRKILVNTVAIEVGLPLWSENIFSLYLHTTMGGWTSLSPYGGIINAKSETTKESIF